jgi:hypothetical protein
MTRASISKECCSENGVPNLRVSVLETGTEKRDGSAVPITSHSIDLQLGRAVRELLHA